MGQASRKRETHAALLAKGLGCIYCAGTAVATTIEHMPPISIFDGRQRPKGLEFPACDACNSGTKHSDLVAAMLARCWPDAEPSSRQKDAKKYLSAVANNVPGVLQEMFIERGAEKLARKRHNIPADAHPFRMDGPLLTAHLETFAAKMGFALHYELTALRQGEKSVGSQFLYSHAAGESDHMLYFASFNLSFAVGGITALDRSILLERQDDNFSLIRSGQFRHQT